MLRKSATSFFLKLCIFSYELISIPVNRIVIFTTCNCKRDRSLILLGIKSLLPQIKVAFGDISKVAPDCVRWRYFA